MAEVGRGQMLVQREEFGSLNPGLTHSYVRSPGFQFSQGPSPATPYLDQLHKEPSPKSKVAVSQGLLVTV
jgi:hypothetical protein